MSTGDIMIDVEGVGGSSAMLDRDRVVKLIMVKADCNTPLASEGLASESLVMLVASVTPIVELA